MTDQRREKDLWKNAVTLGLGAYWIILFISTHVPIDPNQVLPNSDKTLHFIAYGILGALLMLAFLVRRGDPCFGAMTIPAAMVWVVLWAVIAVYAACDEWTQPWVGRHCDFLDWRADITGGAIGLTVAWVVWRTLCSSRAQTES